MTTTPGTPIDREKLLSVGVIGRRTRDRVVEGRTADGVRTKATTDQLGNTVTEHAKGDRVDVLIHAPTVSAKVGICERRDPIS